MEHREEINKIKMAARLPGDCGRHKSWLPILRFNLPKCDDPSCVYFAVWQTKYTRAKAANGTTIGVTAAPTANEMECDVNDSSTLSSSSSRSVYSSESLERQPRPSPKPTAPQARNGGRKRVAPTPLNDNDRAETEQARYIGFPNLGNTCYRNVTLQTLLALTEFKSDVIDQG